MKSAYIMDLIQQYAKENPGAEEPSDNELKAYFMRRGNPYQEAKMNSRYVDACVDISYAQNVVQLHSHDFYEILYCCSGNLQYLLGTDRYSLHRGDIVMIPPGISHRPLIPEQLAEPYKRYVVWFNREFLDLAQLFCGDFEFKGSYHLLRTAGSVWESLEQIFARNCHEAERGISGWQGCICGNTIQLLAQLKRAVAEEDMPVPMAEKTELVDIVVNCIETHLDEKITLESIARRFLVSQSTISQSFRQKLGVSFYRYVTQRRLIAAKSEILSGKPLEIISEMVGFSDYSTFYRAFKQEYGVSPSQYLKSQQDRANQTKD